MSAPSPTLAPDPLDPIIEREDNLTLDRAVATAPSLIQPQDLPLLVEALRRDRARFNIREQEKKDAAELEE